MIDDAKKVADRAAAAIDQFADRKTIAEVQESIVHLHGLLHATEKGDGLAHALFYDKRTADEFTRLETNLSRLSEHVDRGVQHLDAVLGCHRRRRQAAPQQRLARGQERGRRRRSRSSSRTSSATSTAPPATWRR